MFSRGRAGQPRVRSLILPRLDASCTEAPAGVGMLRAMHMLSTKDSRGHPSNGS